MSFNKYSSGETAPKVVTPLKVVHPTEPVTISEIILSNGIDVHGRYWGFISKEPLWFCNHPMLDIGDPALYMHSMAFCRAGNKLKATARFVQRIATAYEVARAAQKDP